MRLGELVGKEIINIFDGMRLGTIANSDLVIDPETGEIVSIILPQRSNFLNFWMDRREVVVPWETVKKIGNEVIIVDLDSTFSQYKR
ncbi:MAG TPA: YlmC/YmxH family sporulation protein [Syntrophomonadaceae bacterium]|nr:YlmC/YmxH family sporulation protein [Syntrophomonadaceae bacterium]